MEHLANFLGMDSSTFCHLCGTVTQATAGDPSVWPLFLPYEGGNGQTRCYHMGCVILAVGIQERKKLEDASAARAKSRYSWFGPDEDAVFGSHLSEAWAHLKAAYIRWKSRGTHATNCMDTAHGVEISCSEVNRTFPRNNKRLL